MIKNLVASQLKFQGENYEERKEEFEVCQECGCVEWEGFEYENPECSGCGNPYRKSKVLKVNCSEGDIWKRELGSMSDGSYRVVAYHSDTYNKKCKEWDSDPRYNGDADELKL